MIDLSTLMNRVADVSKRVDAKPDFRWAVVTSVSPLRIRFDASETDLAGTPDSLVSGLSVDDRVRVEVQNNRATIVGAAGSGGADSGGLPAGAILAWGSSVAPSNWLICDGAAVSRTTYASLFSVIGTQFGTGNGSTTFNLPDLRGRVAVGRDAGQTEFDSIGESGGAKTHTHGEGNFHAAIGAVNGNIGTLGYVAGTAGIGGTRAATYTVSGGGTTGGSFNHYTPVFGVSGSASSLPPYEVVNYIIKFSNGDTPGDSQLTQRVSTLEVADATTNKSGLVPIIPTSVQVGSGSGSFNPNTGKISVTGVNSMSVNGVFTSAYTNYMVQWTFTSSPTSFVYLHARLRANGVDQNTGTAYNSTGMSAESSVGLWQANGVSLWYINVMNGPNVDEADGILNIQRPAEAQFTSVLSQAYGRGSSTIHATSVIMAHYLNAAYDGITFYPSGGTMTGYLKFYGYRDS